MEYLILSDLHLRSGYEKNKAEYLMNLISRYSNIIINGDFYEAVYYNANQFLNSRYKDLIDLLKSRNTIYLYGNHDPKEYAQKVAEYVSNGNAFTEYKIDIGGKKYHIEHGHRLAHEKEIKFNPRIVRYIDAVSYLIERICPWLALHQGRKWNKTVLKQRYLDGRISTDEILVCGHTHAEVFDLENKYVDSGYTKYGKGNFIVINEDGIKMTPFTYPAD